MPYDPLEVVEKLRELQRLIRDVVVNSRRHAGLSDVARSSSADTIYRIDALVEPVIDDYCRHWSRSLPLVVICEGLEPESGKVYPAHVSLESAAARLIIDPIDGTRGIMYDKRPAWSLAGLAPNRGDATRLRDIDVAVMTELPTSKMTLADVLYAVRGRGAVGLRERIDRDGASQLVTPISLQPSGATTLRHGFGMVSNFFPGTKVLAGELMERIAEASIGQPDFSGASVFDDQYICTGGQFYEMTVGHDRFNCDLRPLLYRCLEGNPRGLSAHPYDCCTALIAEEAGVIVTDGLGKPLDGPLDCVTGLSWATFANDTLRSQLEPVIIEFFRARGVA